MCLIYVIFAIFFAYFCRDGMKLVLLIFVLLMGHILITSFSMLGYPAFLLLY